MESDIGSKGSCWWRQQWMRRSHSGRHEQGTRQQGGGLRR